jgi:hypothetical protein
MGPDIATEEIAFMPMSAGAGGAAGAGEGTGDEETGEGARVPRRPKDRTQNKQLDALMFHWLENGVQSMVPRRNKALEKDSKGRREIDSKEQSWVVMIECASRKIANAVVATVGVSKLPVEIMAKMSQSIRKWRPDARNVAQVKSIKCKHNGPRTPPGKPPPPPSASKTAWIGPVFPGVIGVTNDGAGAGGGGSSRDGARQPGDEAKKRMARMYEKAKEGLHVTTKVSGRR